MPPKPHAPADHDLHSPITDAWRRQTSTCAWGISSSEILLKHDQRGEARKLQRKLQNKEGHIPRIPLSRSVALTGV